MFSYLVRLTIALALVMMPATPPVAGVSLVQGVAGEGYRAAATTPLSASLPRVPGLQRYEKPGSSRLMLPPPHIVEGRSADPVKSSISGPLLLSPVRIVESRSDRTVERPAAWPGLLPPARVLQSVPITEVRICNTSDGCDALVTPTLATDSPLVLYAAGHGGDPIQFVENLTVTWAVPAGLTPAPSEGVSTTLDGSVPGNFVVTATVIATPTLWSTATLTVTTGALSSIVIHDAPAEGGNVVTDATRIAGTAWPLYAAGYDVDDNFIGDQAATWTLNGDIGSIPPEVVSSTVFTAGAVGTGSITAAAGPTITDSTGTITVDPGPPAVLAISPVDAIRAAGTLITYTAIATDDLGNFIGDVTTSTLFSISPDSGGTFVGNAATPTVTGTWVVTGVNGAASTTTTVSVTPGAPFTLTLSPATTVISAGARITYTAVATDVFGNFIGDVTGDTTFTISPPTGGSFAANVITPTIRHTYTVTGTHDTTGVSDTAALTVTPNASATLRLSPPTAIASAGVGITYTALMSDAYGNFIGSVTAGMTFSIPTASGGVFAANAVTPTVAGAWPVTGTNGSLSDTALLNVTAAAPFTLTLLPATAVISAGASIIYTAVATDVFGNFIGDVTTDTTFSIPAASGGVFAASAVTPTVAGSWTVTGMNGSAVDTASLSVSAAEPFTLTLLPATAAISAGARITYTAVATDAFGNYIGDVTADTTFSIASASGGVFAANVVTPTVAGSWTVTGMNGSAVDTASLSVTPGAPFTLTLLPATAVISAGARITYTAVATDAFGNFIGDVTGATTFTISPLAGGSFVGNVITPTIRNTYTVTGTHNTTGVSDTAALTVTPNVPFMLTLSPATEVISAGVRITYTAVATDAFGNFIGNVTAGTTFSIPTASGGVFAANIVTPTVTGTWPVTGTHGVARHTVPLTVTPAAYQRLSIEDAPPGIGSPVNAVTRTLYDTLTLYAIAYDVYSNVIGSRSATWAASGILSGTLSPTSGISTTLTPAPVVSGTGIVTATSGPHTDTAGPITILAPSLTIAKLDNQDPVPAGGFLGYTIIYTNVGNAAAQGIVITDTYDPNVTFVGAVPSPNPGTGGTVWSGSLPASLAPGESREIQIFTQVGSSLPISTVVTNTVRISGLKLAQSMPFTQTTKVTVTSDLQLAKVQVSPLTNTVRVSDTINYQLIYTNTGTAILHNVVLTETYDSAVEFVNAIPPPVSGTGNRRWNIGPLSAGQSGFVALTVRVKAPQPDGGPLVNLVTIDSDETEPLTTQSPPIAVRAPMLSLSKHTPATVVPANSILTYTLAYTNSGSTHATGVVITDRLPVSVTFLSAIPPYSQRADDLLTWNFPQVVTHSAGTIAIQVLVEGNQVSGTLRTNTARIAAAEIVSSFASLTNEISSAPNVALSKSDGRTSAAADQVLTYTLTYSNVGNAPAQGVIITDRIPSNVTFVRCTLPCPSAGGVYTFSIGTLDASASGQKTLTVRVSPTLPAGLRAITNTARIRTTTPGDNPTDDFAQDVDAISTVPVLDISASFNATGPYPGKIITHTIRYTNVAAIDTTGVIVSATKSPYVTYLPSSSSCWTGMGGNSYTCTVGNLGAHQSGVLTFVVSLPLTFTQVMSAFVNTFVIADNGPGGVVPAMDIFTATTGVPDLVIESVTFSPGQVVIGTWFTATVVIRNLGQGTGLNPFNGGGTAVDAFIDPSVPPPSSGWDFYGDSFDYVDPVPPGMTTTGTIAGLRFVQGQDFVLYFKIDNWDCHPLPPATLPCTPPEADHGLVPESDETNNVYGPVTPPKYRIFLPLVSKNYVPTFPTFLPLVSKNR